MPTSYHHMPTPATQSHHGRAASPSGHTTTAARPHQDYFGEPAGQPLHAWPRVSCDFGQFDIAGFPKTHAWWYVANWLQRRASGPGRPALPFATVARVLELPAAPLAPSAPSSAKPDSESDYEQTSTSASNNTSSRKSKTVIRAVTTAPFAALFLDGVSQGVQPTPRNARGEVEATEWAVEPNAPPTPMSASASAPASALASAPASTFASTTPAPNNASCSFPVNASHVQCHGLHAHAAAKSAEQCAAACCALGAVACDTWQRETSDGSRCWVGRAAEGVGGCGPPRKGQWVGAQRHTSPGPSPGPGPAPPTPAPPAFYYRNATVVAYSADPGEVSVAGVGAPAAEAAVLATHSLFAPSADSSGYQLALTLDVPSAATGTGGALLLDGRDTALVRAAVVDQGGADGDRGGGGGHAALVPGFRARIAWRVVSGAGRLAGTANGNNSWHGWMKSPEVDTHLGLARGLFRVTADCTSYTAAARARARAVDFDAGRGPAAVEPDAGAAGCDVSPIVVEAAAPGLGAATISIPVSVDAAKDGVLAVATATASSFDAGFSYLADFVG